MLKFGMEIVPGCLRSEEFAEGKACDVEVLLCNWLIGKSLDDAR